MIQSKQEVNIKNTVLCPDCGSEVESSKTTCIHCESDLKLQGKYELLEILGENIGTTYKARFNDKFVVIKELSLRVLNQWKSEELFRRESEILSQLKHEAIPSFIEEFECGIGRNAKSYIVMEHIEGMSLREEFKTKRYTESEVMDILFEIAEILGFLHDLRPPVIHRDLKLSNIMRRSNGKLTIIDFGSVKNINKSQSATVLGTYGFMAPEQFSGRATFASDFYSLGVIALVLLSRKEPEDMIKTGIELDWRKNVYASPEMMQILEHLLETDPKNRMASLKELKAFKKLKGKSKKTENKIQKKTQKKVEKKKANTYKPYSYIKNKKENKEKESKVALYLEKEFLYIEDVFSKTKMEVEYMENRGFLSTLIITIGYIFGTGLSSDAWFFALISGLILFIVLTGIKTLMKSQKKLEPKEIFNLFINKLSIQRDFNERLAIIESWFDAHYFQEDVKQVFHKYMEEQVNQREFKQGKLSHYRQKIKKNKNYQIFLESYLKRHPFDSLSERR